MKTYPCNDCGKTLRPSGVSAQQVPGTVQDCGRGLCSPCHRRRRDTGTLDDLLVQKTPLVCQGCHARLRPGKARAKDYPGTVAHRGKGMCETCNNKAGGPLPDADYNKRILDMRRDLTAWVLDWRRRNGKPLDAPIDGMSAGIGLAA